MKQLEMMKENLMGCIMGQMADLKNADTKELGEAIDMIKDLSEAIYYCTVTEAMKGSEDKEKGREAHYYTEKIREPYIIPDYNRMYYSPSNGNSSSNPVGIFINPSAP